MPARNERDMTKRKIVAAMTAARDCIARLEAGRHLPTGLLRPIAEVMGDDTGRLIQLDKSGFRAPTGTVELPDGTTVTRREVAITTLEDFIDDCRFLLSESEKADARG